MQPVVARVPNGVEAVAAAEARRVVRRAAGWTAVEAATGVDADECDAGVAAAARAARQTRRCPHPAAE